MAFNYPQDFTDTCWLITDGDVYVSSIGDDATGDGSPTNPYATIQKGVDAATAGQRLVVGTGEYRENVDGNAQSNAIVADGTVLMIGEDIGGTAFANVGAAASGQIKGFKVVDYNSLLDGHVELVSDCILLEGDILNFSGTLQTTVLKDGNLKATGDTELLGCTFINVISGTPGGSDNKFVTVQDCHFDATTVFDLETAVTTEFNFCNQEPGSVIKVNSVSYSDSAAVNAAHANFQLNGISELPLFNNTGIVDFSLQFGSALANPAGSKGQHIGAIGTANLNTPETLLGAVLTNINIDAEGRYELVDGYDTGTIETLVIDLGSLRTLRRIGLFAEQNFETPPINAVVDTDNAATHPNKITFEMRFSDFQGNTFEEVYRQFIWDKTPTIDAQGKGNGDPGFEVTSARGIFTRFVQVRITLRDDLNLLLQEDGFVIMQEDGSNLLVETSGV